MGVNKSKHNIMYAEKMVCFTVKVELNTKDHYPEYVGCAYLGLEGSATILSDFETVDCSKR